MSYKINKVRNYRVSGLRLSSGIAENTTFRKLGLVSPSPNPHLRTETDPISETFRFLVFRIADTPCGGGLECLHRSPCES
jgi:hypothetical protein